MPEGARAFDVIVAGELYTDLILSGFDFWPQPGQEAFAKRFDREVGGGAAITACGLARLGSRAAVLGVVGGDGGWLIRQLERYGVATSEISRDATEPTAFTVAVSTPEDRRFLTYLGANRAFPSALADSAAGRHLAHARHVHLAFPPDLDTAAELFASISANGCTLSLDVGWHESWLTDARLRSSLPLLDIFFPNETEARSITGQTEPEQILRWFADAGLARVALKLGARGAALLWDGQVQFAAGLDVKTIDTTGAGDCFNAGFLHSWLKGDPPEICLQAANICGAASTEAYGGVAGVPDAAKLKELLKVPSCEK
jgi:sugar/nucleoside kinase (ribokinase family)